MILSAYPMPRGRAPLNFNHADFPAVKCWFRFEEGTGTALTDKIGNVTGMTLSGSGSHWANRRAITLATATTDRAATSIGNVGFPAAAAGQVILLETDIFVPTDGSGYVCDIGRLNTSSQVGYGSILLSDDINLGEVRRSVSVRNTTWTTTAGLAVDTTFVNLTKRPLDQRSHVLAVIDLTDAARRYIPITVYVDGVQKATQTLDSNSLGGFASGTFRALGDFRIGHRNDNPGTYFTGRMFNLRYTSLSSVPANLTDIAVQMAQNPDELPPLLEGLT